MTVIGLFSVKGAPGTTTVATALAACQPSQNAVLIEADPAGGDLAMRLGISQQPGLAQLAARLCSTASDRSVFDGSARYVARGGFELVMAPVQPLAAQAALEVLAQAGPLLTSASRARSVILDLGRADGSEPSMALANCCDVLAIVLRGDVSSIGHVREADWVSRIRRPVGFVLVDSGPYRAPEAAEALAIACLGQIPFGRHQPHTRKGAKAVARLRGRLVAAATGTQIAEVEQLSEVSAG